ncbi:MAG: NAD(P)-binding domain-containing protein [Bacteroidota bacterium]
MSKLLDYIILGAGPSGLQLGYYMEENNYNYVILERDSDPGAFFKKFPVHRTLISINKVYTGDNEPETDMRWDWNSLISDNSDLKFKKYTKEYFPNADIYVDYLKDFAEENKLNIAYNTSIKTVSKNANFYLEDSNGKVWEAKRLIVATGLGKSHIPDIPGIETVKLYEDLTLDKQEFENKKVLIIGKGNSGFETADYLTDTTALTHICSPTPLRMAWKSHYVGNLRAVNNNFLDTYHLKCQNAVLDADIIEIKKQDNGYSVSMKYKNEAAETEDIFYDEVIACTGFRFDDSIYDDSSNPELAMNGKYPKQTCEWESVNVPDMYFTGTITHMRDYRRSSSSFVHGFRYNAQALMKILKAKYHDKPIAFEEIVLDEEAIANRMLERVNYTSALWQQFGFFCDAFLVKENEKSGRYYEDLPMDYVQNIIADKEDRLYVVTLEYGPQLDDNEHASSKRIDRHDYKNAHLSKFLHPVVRYYVEGELKSEVHLIEDLFAEWKKMLHKTPLLELLQSELKQASSLVR